MEDEGVVVVVVDAAVGVVHAALVMDPKRVAHQYGPPQMPMTMLTPSHLLKLSGTVATCSSYLIMN